MPKSWCCVIRDGRNPRVITPESMQAIRFEYDSKNDHLQITADVDTDNNGKFERDEGQVVFLCKPHTHQAAALTPANGRYQRLTYTAATREYFSHARTDTNGDGRFTEADTLRPYMFRLGHDSEAQPLISGDLEAQAEDILQAGQSGGRPTVQPSSGGKNTAG